MTNRRLGLVTLVLLGVGLGTLAVAGADRDVPRKPQIPVAVVPESEGPTAAYLELQKRAIPQPRGEFVNGSANPMPAIASPSR